MLDIPVAEPVNLKEALFQTTATFEEESVEFEIDVVATKIVSSGLDLLFERALAVVT